MSHPQRHDFFRSPEMAAFDVSLGELDLRQGICCLVKQKIFPPLDVSPRHTIMATGNAAGRTSVALEHAPATGASRPAVIASREQRVDAHDDCRLPGETAHAGAHPPLATRRRLADPRPLLRPAPPRADSSATTSRARIGAPASPPPPGCSCCSRTSSSPASPSTASASGPHATSPNSSAWLPPSSPSLNDDRVGRCLDRLFDADIPSLALAVVVHAVREFAVDLDELHNDSTTITFHGDYETADQERTLRGRLRLAITWGHNKDHRPDLKQLLYILTVTRDGAVPVQFRVQSGNTTDDRSHRATWDLLCKLTGRRDFLYVADCKLATAENMAYIHRHDGRFLSVLPRTRGEDAAFRAAILAGRGRLGDGSTTSTTTSGELVDRVLDPRAGGHQRRGVSPDLVSQHAQGRAGCRGPAAADRAGGGATGRAAREAGLAADAASRAGEGGRGGRGDPGGDRDRGVDHGRRSRSGPRRRYRQQRRGRPGADTLYVKQRAEAVRADAPGGPGPAGRGGAVRRDLPADHATSRAMSAKELLLAYKEQPMIEKRFEQLKTDFVVAPVYLKEVSRIQALLCVYFLALLVESLLERELRRAMEREGIESLPLYPEGRACRRPTARKVIDLFEDVQRHELSAGRRPGGDVHDGADPVAAESPATPGRSQGL